MKKITVTISGASEKFFNEVADSLEVDGRKATDSEVIDLCLYELACFEEHTGESVTSFLTDFKDSRSTQLLQNLSQALTEIEATQSKIIDVFSVIITDDKALHINSSIDVTTQYMAAVIDALEVGLRRLNEEKAKSKP